MSTRIRPNISPKSKYWIGKHRYYELKHFCMQYPEWKSEIYISESPLESRSIIFCKDGREGNATNRTADLAVHYADLKSKIEMIERSAEWSDPDLKNYILKSVTEGVSYTYLSTVMGIPCCRDTFYNLYRKFFFILSNARG